MMLRTWTRRIGVAVLAVLTVGAAGTGAAHADGTTSPTTQASHSITAVGDGVVEGTPNVLALELGVTTRDPSAAAALAHNSELAVKVLGALKNAGVADKDVQTSNLSISPNVSGSGNHVDGYEVDNTVTAKLRDVNKAGDIVDAATKVSGNEIVVRSLSFSFDDNSSMVAAARTLAVKRAQDQARQLADAAGCHWATSTRSRRRAFRSDRPPRRRRARAHTGRGRRSDAPGQPRFADGVGGGDPRVPDRLTSPAGRPR